MRRTLAAVALAVMVAAVWPAGAPAVQPGRLESFPLVFRLPEGDRAAQYGHYFVFFRTRGAFVGRDDSGATIPGRIALEDSDDNHDGFFGLSSRRCYGWNLGDSERLDRVPAGGKIHVSFHLRRTSAETRNVTLRRAPAAVGRRYTPVYERPAVVRALRWIGC
jgi:hypothetical protein